MIQDKVPHRKPVISLRLGLLVIFSLAAVVLAYFVYSASRQFWLSYDVTDIGGFAINPQTTSPPNSQGTPAATPLPTPMIGPAAQPWDGASRVSMLVMGLDYRDWESGDGPPRTDTMILMTLDPLAKTAGILNIPRDLWVNIPGFGYGKINTAYSLGEAYEVPGGGPGLAVQTVEQFLGIPINYYAQVDFFAFEKFIDEIGGVLINIPAEITVDPIGEGNTVTLQPGEQRLYGPELLAYARARGTEGGDFDRADRQQEVILAIRRRLLKPEALAWLIPKAPVLYEELASGVRTNMTLDEAIKLVMLGPEIPLENIQRGAIAPPDQVLFAKSPDGTLDILKPIPDKIRLLRDTIFASSSMISPAANGGDSLALMQAEAARISVLNATLTEGLAVRTQQYLQSQGANVVATGNAGEIRDFTRIIDYSGRPYTLKYLVELMGINSYNIFYEPNPNNDVDVVIILGSDWAANNPMP
jgi:LCP family protein required for cell wall assembly